MVFPLIPSRRSRALEVAGRTSRRRGTGDEIASSRPYRRGDAIRLDRLGRVGAAVVGSRQRRVRRPRPIRGGRRPRDRRGRPEPVDGALPGMASVAAQADRGSRGGRDDRRQRSRDERPDRLCGGRCAGAAGRSSQRRDRSKRRAIEQRTREGEADGPPDSLDKALGLLLRHRARSVPAGTFVFVLSDFLPPPSAPTLRAAASRPAGT